MTFRRPPVIIVKCGEVNLTVITYTKKVCVNHKNVNDEIKTRDCSHKGFQAN